MNKFRYFKDNKLVIAILAVVLIFALSGLVYGGLYNNQKNFNTKVNTAVNSNDEYKSEDNISLITPLPADKVSGSTQTTKDLQYMLEEEKLAHDVYQYIYDKWGARVFGNILKSETSHQNEVLAVMVNRGIADSRSSEFGKFNNKDLQTIYDKLIAQGNQSLTEAYKVGVAIEELDIKDLKVAINSLDSADTDVKATYENLLKGSQNHLAAFNKQLTR